MAQKGNWPVDFGWHKLFGRFNMVMIFDFLHVVGILFRVNQLLSITSRHTCEFWNQHSLAVVV